MQFLTEVQEKPASSRRSWLQEKIFWYSVWKLMNGSIWMEILVYSHITIAWDIIVEGIKCQSKRFAKLDHNENSSIRSTDELVIIRVNIWVCSIY